MRNDDCSNPLIVDEIPGMDEYAQALASLPDWAYPGRQLCPQCGGDGWLVSEGFGSYLPSEDVSPCPECRGKGWTEIDEGQ